MTAVCAVVLVLVAAPVVVQAYTERRISRVRRLAAVRRIWEQR